jgi:membrane protease YdiL (CAAX protease family)
MMPALLLISLFLLVLFDARLLREQHEEEYRLVFDDAPPEKWAFYTSFLFVVMLPIYLLRRKQLKAAVPRGAAEGSVRISGRRLASDAAGVMLLWFCLELFGIILLYGTMSRLPLFESQLSKMLLITVFSSLLMVVLIYRSTRHYPQGFRGSIGFRQEQERTSFLRSGVIPFVLGLGFAFFSATLLMNRDIQPETPLTELIAATDSMVPVLAFLAMAIFLAPFLEEIVFRGYFFGVLRRYKGEAVAVVAVAASFAVLHFDQYWGDWLAIALVTLLGFALTLVRSWSGSTAASIITHYSYNFFVTLIPIATLLVSNPAYVQYVVSYEQLTSVQKETLLQESIEHDPDFYEAHNDLAWLYAQEKRNLEEALDLVDQALRYDPDNTAYLDTKAEVLYVMGRGEEAAKE